MKKMLTTMFGALALGALAIPAQAADYGDKKDIVDTAVAADDFTVLAKALTAAGLVDALKGDGPFTVFAPTDAAFGELPDGTLDMLLKPENKDKLVNILKYHVVSGKVMAEKAMTLTEAEALNGSTLSIEKKDDGLYVGGAKVVKADVKASNGVIHVVDAVILPSE